jgi:hypothetical protein
MRCCYQGIPDWRLTAAKLAHRKAAMTLDDHNRMNDDKQQPWTNPVNRKHVLMQVQQTPITAMQAVAVGSQEEQSDRRRDKLDLTAPGTIIEF